MKREQAFAILQERDRRKAEGKMSDFSVQSRPVDLHKVELHWQRSDFENSSLQDSSSSRDLTARQIMCRTPPPSTVVSLLRGEHWRIPEKILFDVDHLIKGSFKGGIWKWNGRDQIVHSSNNQQTERALLHNFLGCFTSGCEAADGQNFSLAGSYWRKVFKDVELLVRGQYHDIVPNLVQKINDLNREGRADLAHILKHHIAACGQQFTDSNRSTVSIYTALKHLDMANMLAMEESIMKFLNELFKLYLGPRSYNSFVMMMNYARRRLYQDDWVRIEDVLPSVDSIDRAFGVSDRRTLDIISMRIEVAHRRKMYEVVETEAPILIYRAKLIQDDDWQRFYNLTRACFDLSCAQFLLRKKILAT